jgi:hypothetical protein
LQLIAPRAFPLKPLTTATNGFRLVAFDFTFAARQTAYVNVSIKSILEPFITHHVGWRTCPRSRDWGFDAHTRRHSHYKIIAIAFDGSRGLEMDVDVDFHPRARGGMLITAISGPEATDA